MLQRPRGTRDFLPEEMERRRYIEGTMRETARRWGYREVCTPTFEMLELFTLRSGEGIIQEMYVFEDKGGRELVLRPEVTASVLRMYVNEGRFLPKPIRWCYVADCFRYERPQKGRYRQFWQFGAELIGADTAAADAEVILLAGEVLGATGVSFETHVGHLAPMRRMLADFDPAMQRRVMAFLDKRDMVGLADALRALGHSDLYDDLAALAASRELPEVFSITGPIPEQARIEETFALLDAAGMDYIPDFGIARGLDYYTGMVFECFAPNLGAENQILGGGAYRLAHLFGGEDVPSAGFAIGFDRVAVSLGEFFLPRAPAVAVLFTPEARDYAFTISKAFRDAGIRTELNLSGKGIGAQMKHAGREMDYAVIAGEREAASGTVTLRNLVSGEQRECTLADAVAEVSPT